MTTELNPMFDEVLEPFGPHSADFFLASALYHARKVSYKRAAAMAGLSFKDFGRRLREHFGVGFILADETVKEDMRLAEELDRQS